MQALVGVLLTGALALWFGYLLQSRSTPRPSLGRLRGLSWLLTIGLVGASHIAFLGEGAGFRMLVLLVLCCYGMKAVVGVEARGAGADALSPGPWLAFAVIWFGMQPREFRRRRSQAGKRSLLASGLCWILAGILTWMFARHLHGSGTSLRLTGLIVVAAFSMTLHFGLIPILPALFRATGYPVGPQFHAPWRSQNLREFWARRWNVAFSVMTTLAICRPLARTLGRSGALFAGFLASGVFHEVACSLPVQAGFGWPTLYFLLHGSAVLVEEILQRHGVRVCGFAGRIWVLGWVLLPVPFLFHQPFLEGVVRPLL